MALIQGNANTLVLPTPVPDGTQTGGTRMGKDSSMYVSSMFPTKHLASLAGLYYTASQVAGMALVTSLTAVTEASPALIIENSAAAGGPNIMLDYVRIQATAIMAAAVDNQYTWKLDNIRNKWASAGTTFTPQNTNSGVANASIAKVNFGALVVATAQQSSTVFARTIAAGFLVNTATAPAQIIGDLFDFRFGALEAPLPTVVSNVASAGAHTFPVALCIALPPVVLAPGTTATLFVFGTTGGSAPSYNLSMGWYEY